MKLQKNPVNQMPIKNYLFISWTYITAMYLSNLSFQFVSYPTQVLTKSCKPITVMIANLFVMKKRYTLLQTISVLFLTLGIILFLSSSSSSTSSFSSPSTSLSMSLIGIILLAISLIVDGIVGPFQEFCTKTYQPMVPSQMMYYSNVWAGVIIFIAVFFTGEFFPAIQFCVKFSEIYFDIFWFILLNAIGQIFVYDMVANFGSLVLAIVTTSRKFFTIILSVIWFDHQLSFAQWVAVLFVFYGLSLELYSSIRSRKPKKNISISSLPVINDV